MKSFTELPRELRELIYDAVANLAELDEGCTLHSDGETAYYKIQDAIDYEPEGTHPPRPKVPLPRTFRCSRYFRPFVHVNATNTRGPYHDQDKYLRPCLPKMWHVNRQTRRECMERDTVWNTMFDLGGEEFWDALHAINDFWSDLKETAVSMRRLYLRVSFTPQIADPQLKAHVLDHNYHRLKKQDVWLRTLEDYHLLRRMHQQVPCEEPLLLIELTEGSQGVIVKSMFPLQAKDKLYIQRELDLWFQAHPIDIKIEELHGGALIEIAECIKTLERRTEEYQERLCSHDTDLSKLEWDSTGDMITNWWPKQYGWHMSVDVCESDMEIVEEWDIARFGVTYRDTNKWRAWRAGEPMYGTHFKATYDDESDSEQEDNGDEDGHAGGADGDKEEKGSEELSQTYDGTEQETQDDIDGWELPLGDDFGSQYKFKPVRFRKVYKLKEACHKHIVAELRLPQNETDDSDDDEDNVGYESDTENEDCEPDAEQQDGTDRDEKQEASGKVDGASIKTDEDYTTRALQALSLE